MHLHDEQVVNWRTYAAACVRRSGFVALTSVTLTVMALLSLTGCRSALPSHTDPEAAAPVDAMLRGTIRASASIPVDGRTVEFVNVATGQRQSTTTTDGGGFSMRLAPGKYRVELVLRGGESVVQWPGIIELDPSDPDVRADFVVTPGRLSRPRGPAYRIADGLGSPIA
jgi:hypothetical protein